MYAALFTAVFVIAATVNALAGPPAMTLIGEVADDPGGASPRLVIFDSSECEPDNAVECSLLSLDCSSGLGLEISVDGLEAEDVARWLTEKDEMSLKVVGVIPEGEPRATEILRSDLDGTWSVVFIAPFTSDPGLRMDEPARMLAFETVKGSVALRLVGANWTKLEEFVQSCQME